MAYIVAVASAPLVLLTDGRWDLPGVVYASAVTAAVGLFVYGLARLSSLATQLATLSRDLARMAVLRERLRVARDVHDLLGLGLAAVALKSDLVRRLLERGDDDRARTELVRLMRACAAARAESRLVTDEAHRLSFTEELASAQEILASADIQLHTDTGAHVLPAAVDAVLATVLREAVTNVLRHSAARQCTITVGVTAQVASMSIVNDGVSEAPDDQTRRGHGLANLAARLVAAGGRLDSEHFGDRFKVVAQAPIYGAGAA